MAPLLHVAVRGSLAGGMRLHGNAAGKVYTHRRRQNANEVQYWVWGFTAVTGLENGGMIDGSDTSMSGNGASDQGDIVFSFGGSPPVTFPSGTGGGCVEGGPFKDTEVNLGLVQLFVPGNRTIVKDNPLN